MRKRPDIARITVIIPTYNMAALLAEAVESVLANSFSDVELMIADDGSTDNTFSTIRQIRARLDNDRRSKFHYLKIRHQGKSVAINRVLSRARGDFITILDADDKLPVHSLRTRYERATETGAELVLGGFSTFDGHRILGYRSLTPNKNRERLIKELLFNIKSPFHQNSMLVSKALMERVGFYDENLLRAQDKDYAIRLLREANTVEIIDKPVYLYRRYERGYTNRLRNRLRTIYYKWKVIDKHTSGCRRIMGLAWGSLVEVGKMGYEFFSIYKN
ncbi:glycosyltransferase family 2 protein [Halalkalibaculum sp. DA3122]|uniref:glycosyltransferase family 2 protein n=1 Tax=Halalkalibaculum sp. DA3122 TaxID=3373607 RepID=UPI003754D260